MYEERVLGAVIAVILKYGHVSVSAGKNVCLFFKHQAHTPVKKALRTNSNIPGCKMTPTRKCQKLKFLEW